MTADVPSGVPGWLTAISSAAARAQATDVSRFIPPADGSARRSAVLILFGESAGRPDVLLTERAHSLRMHAGQVSFPGGALDEGEGPIDAALREGAEETGLEPSGVDVLVTMDPLWIPVSNFAVTPVVGWWHVPTEVWAVDHREVAAVRRWPLDELLDPDHRLLVRHPSGFVGPAFRVDGQLIWGFTAGLLSQLFTLSGLERPWNTQHVEHLPNDIDGWPRGAEAS